MNRIQIKLDRWIGESEEPYVIAEIGINHNGSFELCKKMIAAAALKATKAAGIMRKIKVQ